MLDVEFDLLFWRYSIIMRVADMFDEWLMRGAAVASEELLLEDAFRQ